MQNRRFSSLRVTAAACFLLIFSFSVFSQRSPQPKPSALFFDSDGNPVSNNEFVDIRMANYQLPDRTLMKVLGDGTVEFRLQKVPQEGAAAPDFSGRYLDGQSVNFADLRGKVVVLNFWFIGCPACESERPLLNNLSAKFGENDNIEFIAVTRDSAKQVKRYLTDNPYNYKMITDAQDILKLFVVSYYPKNIVIGKDGRIVYWRSTIRAWDKFESVISEQLAK